VVIFTVLGRQNQLVKPIADAVKNKEGLLITLFEQSLYLMVHLKNTRVENLVVFMMNKLTAKTRRPSAMIDRWQESRQHRLTSSEGSFIKISDQERNSDSL
jgi:hypothetical protein